MPHAVVHRLSGASPIDRRAIIEVANRALIGVFKMPEHAHPVRLCDYDVDAFLIPRQSSAAFMHIEATV